MVESFLLMPTHLYCHSRGQLAEDVAWLALFPLQALFWPKLVGALSPALGMESCLLTQTPLGRTFVFPHTNLRGFSVPK